ncbi:MAG: spore cortex-lytic enzyme [Clostridiales bacterium]|jgi:N-acetylmuramoyl-L-alanine amidase|nr:spore cortex-lytic enzyme [Clostridiales bacterium]
MKKKSVYIALAVVIAAVALGGLNLSARTADAGMAGTYSTKENVKIVQQKLKDLGYYQKTVDGVFGGGTTTAVKNFQKAKGLAADGVVGAKTIAALGVKLNAAQSKTSGASNADLNLLAKAIHAEARGEPYTGQVAVGAVILNRVKSSKFPNTIGGVIYQPYAFTAVADGQINLTPGDSAKKAAQDALNGWDPTNGCLYYYNPATATSQWIWGLKVTLKIGRHNFCLG